MNKLLVLLLLVTVALAPSGCQLISPTSPGANPTAYIDSISSEPGLTSTHVFDAGRPLRT